MRNRLCAILFATLACLCDICAQGMTFKHDVSIMGQFLTMETGAGALSPAAYYNLFHKGYQATANVLNKSVFRLKYKTDVEAQKAQSDTVRSNLKRRAIIADWDMVASDPSADVAWRIEGPKIESKMAIFQRNIARIMSKGGTEQDRENWTQTYKCLQSSIDITRKSYLTLGERQKEYISIYKRIVQKMSALSACFTKWNGYQMVENFNKAGIKIRRLTKNSTIAYGCLANWQENLSANDAAWKKSSK